MLCLVVVVPLRGTVAPAHRHLTIAATINYCIVCMGCPFFWCACAQNGLEMNSTVYLGTHHHMAV